jgi:hypothetical protein
LLGNTVALVFDADGNESMFGDAPEWTFWALVGLLAFLMILPGLKR